MLLQLVMVTQAIFGATGAQNASLGATPADFIARTAKVYLGEQYVYGDSGDEGYDCSSFVQAVFLQSGYALPRTSREQVEVGAPVDFDRIRAGDLLFFTSEPGSTRITHVAIALGHNRMIHASRGHQRVVISRWDQPYYMERWFAARRIR